MNKIIALTFLLLLVVCGSSFAAALASGAVTPSEGLQIYGGTTGTAAATDDNMIGKLSKGVMASFNFDAINGLGYAVLTKHSSGTQMFGTADDSTAIFRQTVGDGALTATPSAAGNTAFATNWTEM